MNEDLHMFRKSVREFIQKEFTPNQARWREQHRPDAEAWKAAGATGMLLPDVPEEYGGGGGSFAHEAVVLEELARAGVHFASHVHNIVAQYILAYGSQEQKCNWLPRMALGELVGAIAITEPAAGSDMQGIKTTARREGNCYVVGGVAEREGNKCYNTAAMVGPEGYIGKYQKMYLPTHSVFEEKRYFRPGYQIPVFETEIGKLGIIICYDVYFPEVARMLSLKGAKLIVCISASPSVRRGFFETLTAARAIENTVFVAFVNLAGIEDGLQFWGGSRIIAPSGNLISQAKYDEDDLITARINYSDLTRVQAWVPTLRDLRPEIFSSLREEAESL